MPEVTAVCSVMWPVGTPSASLGAAGPFPADASPTGPEVYEALAKRWRAV